MFSLSPIYSACKSSKHKLSTNYKFTENKTYTNIEHKIFAKLVPSVSPLFKKKTHIRLGHAGIVDHSVDLAILDFLFKVYIKKIFKKGTDRSNKKIKQYYINA